MVEEEGFPSLHLFWNSSFESKDALLLRAKSTRGGSLHLQTSGFNRDVLKCQSAQTEPKQQGLR